MEIFSTYPLGLEPVGKTSNADDVQRRIED
jgi:hypothetical protein